MSVPKWKREESKAEFMYQTYNQSWRGYAKKCDNYKAVGEMDQYFNKIMKEVDFSDYRRAKRSNGEKPETHSGTAE